VNVIVTGAAQGIGEGVARWLAEEGHRLVLADIQAYAVAAVARELGASAVEVDIADPESARNMASRAIAELGHVDALVNIAGLNAPLGTALTTDEDLWRRVIDVDLSGPWWCTKALLEHFLERGGGRVVIISSGAAWGGSDEVTPAYSAAKSGLHGLVTALAHQLERSGILVNAIAPGATGTGRSWSAEERMAREQAAPLGLGGTEPIAQMVAHLLGPGGAWISGAILNVSGGITKGR
jgi:3-oxoacyl-[acyl-carrier protein] reductase